MAFEPDANPAALNRDLRVWVKNWTGMGIGQVAARVNISNSRAYAATAGSNLIPRDMLRAIVRATVQSDPERRDALIQDWDRRWIAAEAAARGDLDSQPAAQFDTDAPVTASTPNTVVRLPPDMALPALEVITDDEVRDIVSKHIFVSRDPLPVGYHKQTTISAYLDLHTASCDPGNRERLAQFLAVRVHNALDGRDSAKFVLATPREGNMLVGSRVAELCGLPFLMVRTTAQPRFGQPVEGIYVGASEAVVIDDIVMTTLIPRTAHLLRTHAGLVVRRCVSIFERADVGARATLAEADISLDSAFKIDEDLLASIRQRYGRYD